MFELAKLGFKAELPERDNAQATAELQQLLDAHFAQYCDALEASASETSKQPASEPMSSPKPVAYKPRTEGVSTNSAEPSLAPGPPPTSTPSHQS